MSQTISMTTDWLDQIAENSRQLGILTGQAAEKVDPSLAPACLTVGTGRATFCGDGSPLTQVAYLAYNSKFVPTELDEIEDFYKGRASSWEYVATPSTDPALIVEVIKRGWTEIQFENVMGMPLEQRASLPPALEVPLVKAVSQEDIPMWAEIGNRGFFGDDIPDFCANLSEIIARTDGTTAFLAYIDGQPACAATLAIVGKTCYLGGAATLPEFRGRGAQSALLKARLENAVASGCDLALCECIPGSQSQRNQERAGFQVVYTKMVLTRPQ